jgi:tRNA-dihydrouridine synthase
MRNFWAELPKPFFVMAPLANVTDAAFRRLIAKYSKPQGPDVMYTEFVSADGLVKASEEGRAKLMRDLVFTDAERPIVAQFFTSNPEHMEAAARLAQELGFDGVDINMGCPDKTIEKQGAGAKLILNPTLARELVAAAKRGAPNLPVSVKTRLGYNKDILEEWLPEILKAEPAVLILHARTRKEMSLVPARWERVKRAVEIRNELGVSTLIVGNGDLRDISDATAKVEESGADGAMLGRAIFGTPWLFAEAVPQSAQEEKFPQRSSDLPEVAEESDFGARPFALTFPLSLEQKLRIAIEHTKLFEELLGDIKSFAIMKKHFKAYVEGFHGAKELRVKLMETGTAAEVEKLIEEYLSVPYTDGI